MKNKNLIVVYLFTQKQYVGYSNAPNLVHIESYEARFYLFTIRQLCNVLFTPKIASPPLKN